jgi:cyclopropane fatty-acyl-phospholipid synthase-like methyltransferase
MDQLENFLINSSRLIKNDGKIILFDIIDPCLYWSWKYGRGSPSFSNDFLFVLKVLCLSLFDQMHSMIARKPIDLMGYAYHPSVIEAKAEKNGLRMEYVSSMYYEYRYHAILKKYKI